MGRRRDLMLNRLLPFSAAFLLALASGAGAQDYRVRKLNVLSDIERSQRSQAESLRRIERIESDRYRDMDRARRNAERDARSARRFDRP